jgi:hypothetical protein
MRQWEIYLFPFTQERPHPAVVISHEDRCERCDQVNALICSSARLNRAPEDHEIVLNEADGLDWKTACRCDVIYLLPKAGFLEKRGLVSLERQRQIARKLNECLRFKPTTASFGENPRRRIHFLAMAGAFLGDTNLPPAITSAAAKASRQSSMSGFPRAWFTACNGFNRNFTSLASSKS